MLWTSICHKGAVVLFSLLVHLQSQVGFREGFEFVRSIDGILPTLVVAMDNVALAVGSRALLAAPPMSPLVDAVRTGSTHVKDVLVMAAASLGLHAAPSTSSVMYGPAYCSDLIVRPTSDLTIYMSRHQLFSLLKSNPTSNRAADIHVPMFSPNAVRLVGITMIVFYFIVVGFVFIFALDHMVGRRKVGSVGQEKLEVEGGQFALDVTSLVPLTEDDYLPKANDWFQRIATGVSDPAISVPNVSLVQSDSSLSLPPVVTDIQIEWFDGAVATPSLDYVVVALPEQQCALQDVEHSAPAPVSELIVTAPESPNFEMTVAAPETPVADDLPSPAATQDFSVAPLEPSPSVYEDSPLSDSPSISIVSPLRPASPPASIDAVNIPLPPSPGFPGSHGVIASIHALQNRLVSPSAPASPTVDSSSTPTTLAEDDLSAHITPGTVIYSTPVPPRCITPTEGVWASMHAPIPPRCVTPTEGVWASMHAPKPPSKEAPSLPKAALWATVHGPPPKAHYTRSSSSRAPHSLPLKSQGGRSRSSGISASIHAPSPSASRAPSTPPPSRPLRLPTFPSYSGIRASMHAPSRTTSSVPAASSLSSKRAPRLAASSKIPLAHKSLSGNRPSSPGLSVSNHAPSNSSNTSRRGSTKGESRAERVQVPRSTAERRR